MDTAFKNFFDGRKYPKFKTRQKFKSFSYPPNQVKLEGNKIYFPSIGWMRFFKSRNIPDVFQLKTVTVRQKADGWYVSIRIENKDVPQSKSKYLICVDVNPKWTSQKCSHCGHTQKENRNKERFLCLNCGFLADADIQASTNIGFIGLETLGISPSKLLRVTEKVTAKPESTGSAKCREKSPPPPGGGG